jgi:molybdopterin converting factor small subunit
LSVEIAIPQFLRHLVDGVKVADVSGGTVGDCLNDLVTQLPQLKKLIFTRSGKLRNHLDVYINGESAYPEELARPVIDGDKLHIVNAIVGG